MARDENPSSDKPLVMRGSTEEEIRRRDRLVELLRASPIPTEELPHNLGLYLTRQTLARLLFMQELYRLALPVHGVIAEFGVRWGQNMALWTSLRGIFEPYNYNRKIIGFDTFTGFPSVHEKDGGNPAVRAGAYGVSEGYAAHLEEILAINESQAPIPHIRKFELVQGDVTVTLDDYLGRHPETIFALVYFDFDLYEPTRHCLERIAGRLVKGSVIGFDELNMPQFPGETLALMETLGLRNVALRRLPYSPLTSYFVVD